MIVLILVLVWVAALLPIALKKRSEWELSTSISQFRQRRQRLVRYREHGDPGSAGSAGAAGAAGGQWGGSAARSSPGDGNRWSAPAPMGGADRRAARAARARRRALQARRRRTLGALVATMAATLVLGAVPALRPLWDLTLVATLALVAYVAALVWFRRAALMAVERERNVIELAARARQSAIVPLRPRPPFVIVEATS
ncbi:MAG: hypothetical protein M0T71_03350 [Actinomycetota bacterium]|nr:hypothetical protein [Actinomycetota bacterium]